MTTTDSQYMARALQLARRGLMTTHPNPRVGCVLVKGGNIVGEGWHERAGGPHAEVMALADAGNEAPGTTAYITLEPCSHHGRTPPCANALVEAKVERVVVAMSDPNPLVSGQGISVLKAAGIDVSVGLMTSEAEQLNRGFCQRMSTGRPWVSLKMAMSLDGRSAAADGSSQWITAEPARQDVHRRRAEAGAVLTGIGSVLDDDSRLNVRLENTEANIPHRIVLDSNLRMPLDAAMLSIEGRTTVLTCSDDADKSSALQNAGAGVVRLKGDSGQLDLQAVVAWLGESEVNEVLVETGSTLAGAFIEAGLVDELVLYVAPKLLGDSGKGLLSLPGITSIGQARAVEIMDVRAIGHDLCVTAILSH